MKMPSAVRKTTRNVKVGENPAMKLHAEYPRIEIISGSLRPTLSAAQPEPTAPIRRAAKVSDNMPTTSLSGTPNSCEIGTMISRNTVKSNASRVQPSHAAHQAYH